jgi:outer membrane protein assembly factor BamB
MTPLKARCLFLGWALLSFIGGAFASDWPGFRGPTGQGTSTAKGLPTQWSGAENIAWKTELPGPGTSSPVVFGNKVFVTCYSGFNVPGEEGQMEDLMLHLVCLDRATGEKLWTTDVKPKLPELEQFRRDQHGYASGTPAVDAERVYVFWGKTGAVAYSHDGDQLWEQNLGDKIHEWGSCGCPVLYQNLVIINACVESESLVALDKKTGKEVWRAKDLKESWNTPILVPVGKNKTELVVAEGGRILGYDPATGEELWNCATDIPWYMVPSLVADKGVVYCVGGRSPGGSLAVKVGGRGDVTKTHRLWTSNKGSNVTSPLYHDGHLYWMHESQEIAFCLKADTGKVVYEERVTRRDQMYPSPVLADGKIYYVNRIGTTFVVPAKPEFEILETNSLGERGNFMSSPAVSGKTILIRSNSYLYCIGKE